jgi:hypothetical protein
VFILVAAPTVGGVGGAQCWLSFQEAGLVICGLEGRPGMIYALKVSPGSLFQLSFSQHTKLILTIKQFIAVTPHVTCQLLETADIVISNFSQI